MANKMRLVSDLKEIRDGLDDIQIFAEKMKRTDPSDLKTLMDRLLNLRLRCNKLYNDQANTKTFPKFRPNDCVRRKDRQGRAEMFVESVHEDIGIIICGWYAKCEDGSKRLFTDKFGTDALEFVVPEGEPQPKTTEELSEEAAQWNREREKRKAKQG